MATTKNRRRRESKRELALKVPLKMKILRSCAKKGKSMVGKKGKCRVTEVFSLHPPNKFSFMKVLGLQFALPIGRVKTNNNNDRNHLDNNNTRTLLHALTRDASKNKTIECYPCKRRFRSQKSYDIHVKNKHRFLLPFSCKICSRKFLNRSVLQQHKIKHQGRKPYSCSKCNNKFECLDALTAHIRRHLGKLPYVCKICKDGFDFHLDYKQHLQVHEMKPSERPIRKIFLCPDCDKEFRKPCDLERHMRVHTGERPFVCAVCGNRFQQAHNLTKHMVIHTRERRFQCEICLKLFGRNDVLTRHMLTHAVHKPFSCPFCNKTFARALQLTQHTTKHHENF